MHEGVEIITKHWAKRSIGGDKVESTTGRHRALVQWGKELFTPIYWFHEACMCYRRLWWLPNTSFINTQSKLSPDVVVVTRSTEGQLLAWDSLISVSLYFSCFEHSDWLQRGFWSKKTTMIFSGLAEFFINIGPFLIFVWLKASIQENPTLELASKLNSIVGWKWMDKSNSWGLTILRKRKEKISYYCQQFGM